MRPPLTEAPSLHQRYPASPVLRTSPPPHTARPVSRELPVDPNCDHRWGFPCCVWSPMHTCHRHYPGRSDEVCPLVYLHRLRPSLCNSQVGSCNCFFGACSAFTHVMACTLAESPSEQQPISRAIRLAVHPGSFAMRHQSPPLWTDGDDLRHARNLREALAATASVLGPAGTVLNLANWVPHHVHRHCMPGIQFYVGSTACLRTAHNAPP